MRAALSILVVPFVLGLGGGCVVKYGGEPSVKPAEPLPAPVDFGEVEERLEALIEASSEIDRRDRLMAARDLSRGLSGADPAVQAKVLRYLQRLVEIEERQQPMELAAEADASVMTFAPIGGAVEEEELGEPVQPAPQSGAETLAAAEALADSGDTSRALTVLESCRSQACWPEVEAAWIAMRDGHLAEQQAAAGEAFIAARAVADPVARAEQLRVLRDQLASLVDRYPDAPATADLRRNVELVQKELAASQAP